MDLITVELLFYVLIISVFSTCTIVCSLLNIIDGIMDNDIPSLCVGLLIPIVILLGISIIALEAYQMTLI